MPSKGLAIVLLSGGMDSTVCMGQARADGYEIAALHVNYGQRTMARELRAFDDVADHYRVKKRLVVDISHLAAIGGSSLTDEALEIPKGDDPSSTGPIPSTYVPFRNANILAIATSWAEVIDADCIYIGAVEEDSSGYPDCRQEFFAAFETVISTGTRPETSISIKTPLIALSKKEIVEAGMALQAPLHLSWSCYAAEDKACGTCDSCTLRLRGFAAAGISDPIEYQ